MKEIYTKPVLHIETFRLSQSIANSCNVPPAVQSTVSRANMWYRSTCGWAVGDTVMWLEGTACNYPLGVDDEVNGYCYNNPSAGLSIFHS